MSARDLFIQQFNSTTIEKLVGPSREILTLEPTETIFEVIKKLQERDIRSAPVVHSNTETVFVDFIDIVAYIVDTYEENEKKQNSNSNNSTPPFIHASTIENVTIQQHILNTPANTVANYSKLDKFAILPPTATAFDAASELSKGNKRVVVKEESSNQNTSPFVNIVTHSDVMNLMKQTIDDHGAQNFSTSIESARIGVTISNAIIVTEDKKAIDAFSLMRHHGHSFVPVVNEDRQLISVISARDIQVLSLGEDGFKMLNLPVLDFLSTVRQLSPVDKYPFIFCFSNSTIDLVVKRLKATRVNRLLVINEDKFPIGVVSVAHLAQYIVGHNVSTNETL